MKTQIIFGIIVSFMFAACSKTQNMDTQSKLPTVEVVRPKQTALHTTIAASGIIANSEEIVLSFKTGGIVEAVSVEEGQYVQKGQMLAKLNTTELDAQLGQANLNLEKLKRDESRLKQLVRDTTATLEQLQNVQTVLSSQQQQVQSLAYNRQQALLHAPASGFILKKQVNAGEFKTPGTPVFVIGSNSDSKNESKIGLSQKWTFKVSISDRDRVKLRENQRTIITLDAISNTEFEGTVIKLSSIPDAQTGTYDCYVSFNPGYANVVYGLSGKLSIPHQSEQQYTELPLEALNAANANTAFIYTVNTDTIVEKQTIRIHNINKTTVSLEEQLSSDVQVVVTGKNNVVPGQKVKIVHFENYAQNRIRP